jgi:hypothetical protein
VNGQKIESRNHENKGKGNEIQICHWYCRSAIQQGSVFGSGHSDLLQRAGAEPVVSGAIGLKQICEENVKTIPCK